MGFHSQWVSWIMECVSTVSYSILINGVPHKSSKPSRGIRQGDPLSLYLFNLCAKLLSCLLLHVKCTGYTSSFLVGRGFLRINHLFFANDSFFFFQVNSIQWSRMLLLIGTYEQASRQLLNKENSSIFFRSSNHHEVRNTITMIASTRAYGSCEKYMGFPTLLGRSKIKHFQFLLNKTWSRMSNQKTKFLSIVGREILPKVVLQAPPTTLCLYSFYLILSLKSSMAFIENFGGVILRTLLKSNGLIGGKWELPNL